MLRGGGARLQTRDSVTSALTSSARACAGSAQSSIRPARRASTRRSGWSRRSATAVRMARRSGASGRVALAHTRLAIIDVAGGDQPLDSEDGRVTAIVNGEIYNHRELRAELEQRGHRLATELGQRGRRARLRGARPRLRPPPQRHLRLRALGRPRAAARRRPRRVRRQAALLVERTAAAWRSPPRSARCSRPASSTPARGPRRARPLPRLPLRARAAHAVRGRQQAAGRLHARRRRRAAAARDELARGARRARSTAPTTTSSPTSSPSASPTPSSAR